MARRKTNDEFKKEVRDLIGGEYIFLEDYKGSQTHILCKHRECGHEWNIIPNNFLKGTRCPECATIKRSIVQRKTNEEFVKEVFELVGDEYVFLDKYINSQTKIKCRHNKCRHEWLIIPNSFLRGASCPKCSNQLKVEKYALTFESVKNFIEIESNSGCKLLSKKYKNNRTQLTIQCLCGREFMTTFNSFKQAGKRQCNICSGSEYDYEYVKQLIEVDSKSNCRLLSKEYESHDKKLIIECKCGEVFESSISNFIKSKMQCNDCSTRDFIEKRTKTDERFSSEVYSLVQKEYFFVDKYINAETKIMVFHSRCGQTYKVAPQSFLMGKRCPHCNESKGEQFIRRYLNANHINFTQEYTFDGLVGVNGGLLRFDFAIFDEDKNLASLVEYDGEFHFKKYYEEQNFEEIQIHDKLKDQYCKDNDISLLRIPYWEFDNIEERLEKWLTKIVQVSRP